ncbi:MAG: TIGR03808 family TAT-translocated repetitive protein [Hyphomicrobiales bacterium]
MSIKRKISRRGLLSKATFAGAALTISPSLALPMFSRNPRNIPTDAFDSHMIHAQAGGVVPGSREDQSANFQKLLNQSAEQDVPIFLPGGVYKVGGLVFPRRTRIIGVPGSTRLTFNGRNFLARAERADLIHVHGIIFDGLSLPLSENGQGLLTLNTVRDLRVSACDFVGSGLHGLDLTGAGGTVSGCYFHSIRDTAIFSKQSTGMTITDNSISECGNGGILVHRFTLGDDGSVVSNNRIENIKSTNGGTGQWGNGINIYQAHNVMVSNNRISNCAFSSVRANAGHNIQILGNSCSNSGETALYGEFSFEGAVVSNNIVDGGTIGISLANFNEGGRLATVTGNIIRNLTNKLPYKDSGDFKPGIGIYAEADTVITGNAVENVPQAGIHVGWGEFCRNVVVSQNVIRAAPWGVTASVVKGARDVIIKDNVFGNISKQAITGFEWIKPVTKELLGARRTGFNHLSVSGNRLS